MDEHEKPTIGFWAAVVAAMLVPALYVIAYLLAVQPVEVSPAYSTLTVTIATYPSLDQLGPGGLWTRVFTPANALDRWLRPAAWPSTDRSY